MSNVAEQKQKKEKMCVMQQKHLGRQTDCVTIRLDVSLCVTTKQNDSQDNCQVHPWGRSFINSGQEEKKFIPDPRLSSFECFSVAPLRPATLLNGNVPKTSDKSKLRSAKTPDSPRVRTRGFRGRGKPGEMNMNRWNKSPPIISSASELRF